MMLKDRQLSTVRFDWDRHLLCESISRRQVGRVLGAAVALGVSIRGTTQVSASGDATPDAVVDSLDRYLELKMTSTDTELKLPGEITAGRYLVTIENQSTQGESAPVFVLLADGQTVDELMAEPADPATGLPGWFLSGTIVGTPITPLGKTAQAIIDFPAGNYAAMGEPYQPTLGLTVTPSSGEPAMEDPAADATVTMADDGWTGMPETVTTGTHLWKVTSGGTVPHRFEFYSYPEPVTVEGLVTAFTLGEATPPAGTPDISLAVSVGGLSPMSAGHTGWPVIDLEPGFYIGLCTMQNGEAAVPHYLSNELTVLEVVEESAG